MQKIDSAKASSSAMATSSVDLESDSDIADKQTLSDDKPKKDFHHYVQLESGGEIFLLNLCNNHSILLGRNLAHVSFVCKCRK